MALTRTVVPQRFTRTRGHNDLYRAGRNPRNASSRAGIEPRHLVSLQPFACRYGWSHGWDAC